ncbi:MAG TPA: biopolymer transporter ExbD [Polyangia bacterium]|jgi:biopolymer transport protein TolR|nr:biopolymer transporter ExbD [Polyangia bacterium]
MGVSVDTGGKGGKKSVNADLNLVPYIDLLTCMVAFLLITAVWSQLARLEAHQKGQGQAGEDTPPEKVFKLVVLVNDSGFNLVADQDQQPIPKKGDSYDYEKLGDELKKIKDTHADKTDIQVASDDSIHFEILVKTMDTALSSRFPDISLIDSGGAGI